MLAIEWVREAIHSKWFELLLIVFVATIHGYGAAWLAVRMLFRPHRPVKFLGITVWPQGMIPRHRERLAQTIGNAVGNELVSQETVVHALFETGFFRRKVEGFVGSYTDELLNKNYATFLDAIPRQVRAPVLDALSALQLRIAEHIASVLKSEETAEAVNHFIDRRVDEVLSQRLGEVVSPETFEQVLGFVENRFRGVVTERGFESKVREFVSGRVDELARSRATLAEMFTPDTVAVIKERIDSQVPPIVQHLTEIATNKGTRKQIGALIKREVDDYYQQLSFFKKIFISRERVHHEVDDLVNKTLPKRVGEYLSGEAFEHQAEEFLNSTIDGVLARPVNELVGQIAPDRLGLVKDQIAERILAVARSTELSVSVSAYATDALQRLRPHSLRALLEHARPDSAEQLKGFLSRGLMNVLSRDETARTINSILTAQVEKLLVAPIGRVGDLVPEEKVRRASEALTERITAAARERLPGAIAEFDIGGIVREKVSGYPIKKLEDLVLSVAKHHLRTIELFGLGIGFFIGIVQAALLYFRVIGF
ncbi:MAG TPA: DUF445 family protein [Pyrinomonadaceae bacterium]|nr:DUF445 family protein [Pyrinomonadaceae bacterium]